MKTKALFQRRAPSSVAHITHTAHTAHTRVAAAQGDASERPFACTSGVERDISVSARSPRACDAVLTNLLARSKRLNPTAGSERFDFTGIAG